MTRDLISRIDKIRRDEISLIEDCENYLRNALLSNNLRIELGDFRDVILLNGRVYINFGRFRYGYIEEMYYDDVFTIVKKVACVL